MRGEKDQNDKEKRVSKVQAWADFVYELRRHGYWGDPERYRGYFENFFSPYFEGKDDRPYAWYLEHCCDWISGDEGFDGPYWNEWTEEDERRAKQEHERLISTPLKRRRRKRR